VLASSFSHICRISASALALSLPATSRSNTLPWRTLLTPSKPSDFSAPSIALPCGSSTDGFSVTVTRALILSLHQSRPRIGDRIVALGQDAEPLGYLAIGLDQSAEIAAEPVLVHLLVGLHVPQAARIRADLVGDDDPHHVVLPQAATF